MQVGVSREINLNESALRGPEGREKIIVPERLADLRGADVESRHLFRLQPDAHGKGASAENLRALDAVEGREARLNDAREIIGDLVRLENVRGEAQIAGGES